MTFKRTFGQSPGDLEKIACTPWGRDLLSLWRPAGQATGEGGLRLAVRNGTLNFYRRGQSVAKVGFAVDGNPHMDIHIAYVTGERGLGQHYARLSSLDLHSKTYAGALPSYGGPDTLAKWVIQADCRKGAEKEFVDDLVTHNPQVIDLEMGLSAYPSEAGALTAPRMDLVALELTADEAMTIVFWEAKMMGNGDLRCRPGTGRKPHVVGQLSTYTTWLNQGDNRADVIAAYQANCRLMRDFHQLARDINPRIGRLDPRIVRAAEGSALTVDDRPRLVVRDPKPDSSWIANGHDRVLATDHNIQVQLISGAVPASYALHGQL